MTQIKRCGECGAELPTGETEGLCPKCLMGAGLESQGDCQEPSQGTASDAATAMPGNVQPPEPADLAPHFPQLNIEKLLGVGGMGAVYKASQTKLDRSVALKIIKPESTGDPAFAERFNREARALARLNHPNIVGVHDYGEAGELYYLIMEYVDGVNLRELLQGQQLKSQQALTIVPQICEALQFAHDEGIVHRDIKPENILIDNKGRVKIADFGLAKLAAGSSEDFTLTGTHQVMGTPRYMAPEQMEGSHQVDHRADIYSLGVVFYEMLTGEIPLGHFDPPSKKLEVDVRLDEVVLRSLAREPQRRYQRADQVKTDVEMISGSLDAAAPAASPTKDHPEDTSFQGQKFTSAENPSFARYSDQPKDAPQIGVAELRAAVMKPAIGLITVGSLSILVQIGLFFWLYGSWMRNYHHMSLSLIGWVVAQMMVVVLAATIGMIFGAVSMLNMNSLRDAQASAIAALLPLPGIIIGLPLGLWALAVLSRPEISCRFQLQTINQTLWKTGAAYLLMVLCLLFLLSLVFN